MVRDKKHDLLMATPRLKIYTVWETRILRYLQPLRLQNFFFFAKHKLQIGIFLVLSKQRLSLVLVVRR